MSTTASKADEIVASVWTDGRTVSAREIAAATARLAALVASDDTDRRAIAEAQEFLGMHPAAGRP